MLATMGNVTIGLLLLAGGFATVVVSWLVARVALGSSRMLAGWRKWAGVFCDCVLIVGALVVGVLIMSMGVMMMVGVADVS